MKKSLLALAVAAALPAVAFAQTNIVLNGSIDQALEYVDTDIPGQDSDLRVTNAVWAGSRLAISGTEELGGGLKGTFNIEHRLAPDTGTVTSGPIFWAGQSWVGLEGGFGAVRLGRQYSPMFRALAVGDTTGYSFYNNVSGGTLVDAFGAPGGWTLRFENDISYQSPKLAGFTIHAAYAAGEAAPVGTGFDSNLNDRMGIGAVGAFGPVSVGLAYHMIDAGDTIGADDGKELGLALGGKFGNFGLGLAGTQVEDFGGNKRKMYYASASMGIGAGTVYLVYFNDDRGLDNQDVNGLALTYSHGLSKRTFVYASLGANKVELATGEDIKPQRVALGVRHFF